MFGMQIGRLGRLGRVDGRLSDAQKILALFKNGEQGLWLDPSDFSTMFQDAAFTVPVTAVEQPVGGMLDLSGRGNHASMATTTKRPIYSRRVNYFTESEFPNGLSDAPGRDGLLTASALPGYAGAITFGHNGTNLSYAYKSANLSGVAAVLSVVVKMTDGLPPVTSGADSAIDFVLVVNGGAVTTEKMIALGDGCYRVFSYPHLISASNTGIVKYQYNSPRTFQVTAYDLRPAADSHLPYQRVNTGTDYDADPAKFPAYLRFDGVDDALQTGNIDFTGTDKMTVWAGVWAPPDDGRNSAIVCIPDTGLSRYWLGHPFSGFTYSAAYGATTERPIAAPFLAGNAIITASLDLAGVQKVAINGGTPLVNVGGTGGGNFRNAPLRIGADIAGNRFYFNGRLYPLIIRGAQSSLSQSEATEAYIKQKMKLP